MSSSARADVIDPSPVSVTCSLRPGMPGSTGVVWITR